MALAKKASKKLFQQLLQVEENVLYVFSDLALAG